MWGREAGETAYKNRSRIADTQQVSIYLLFLFPYNFTVNILQIFVISEIFVPSQVPCEYDIVVANKYFTNLFFLSQKQWFSICVIRRAVNAHKMWLYDFFILFSTIHQTCSFLIALLPIQATFDNYARGLLKIVMIINRVFCTLYYNIWNALYFHDVWKPYKRIFFA